MFNTSVDPLENYFLTLSKKSFFIAIVSVIFDNILCRGISAKQKVEFEYQGQNWRNRQLGLLVLERRNFVTFHLDKL